MNEATFAIMFIISITINIALVHAYLDAVSKLRKTERLYNIQPRIKPIKSKLAWTGLIIHYISKLFI